MIFRRKTFKITLNILLLCVSIAIFLISQIRLKKEQDRVIITPTLSAEMKEHITEICITANTPKEIIFNCSDFACSLLSFSAKNDIPNGNANCIGYAQLTSEIVNYAFQIKNLPYRAKPVVGKVYLLGIDLNNFAQKILPKKHRPFFKDHDFVEVALDDETIYIDSSLQDILKIRVVSEP